MNKNRAKLHVWTDHSDDPTRQQVEFVQLTSFFARGQRAFKLVLKSIKEEEGGGREERRRKEKEEERNKEKCEKENIKADEKRGSSDANGKINRPRRYVDQC